MWRVVSSPEIDLVIDRAPQIVRTSCAVWRSLIELQGPDAITKIEGFRERGGDWPGIRAVNPCRFWRMQYTVHQKTIYLLEITLLV